MKIGATASIPVAMVFKKYYCHKCGKQLKRQKITKDLNPGDPGYEAARENLHHFGIIAPRSGTISVSEYVFVCTKCNSTITFDEQKDIASMQKYTGSLILEEKENIP